MNPRGTLSQVIGVPEGIWWKMKLKVCLKPWHGRPYIPEEGFHVVTFSSQSINVLQIYNGYLLYGEKDQRDS